MFFSRSSKLIKPLKGSEKLSTCKFVSLTSKINFAGYPNPLNILIIKSKIPDTILIIIPITLQINANIYLLIYYIHL